MRKYFVSFFISVSAFFALFSVNLAVAASSVTITLADNNKIINLSVGDVVLVKLGATYDWSLRFRKKAILERVPNLALVRGAQGVYKVRATGTVILTATGDPQCRKSRPACAMPSRLFKVTIVVKKTVVHTPTSTISVPPISVSTSSSVPTIGGCEIFPSNNPWNQDVSKLPVRNDSTTFINSIGLAKKLHPDFGSNLTYGIPFNIVNENQIKVPIRFTAYGNESDPGPYPVPANAAVEGGVNSDGDRHVLVLQTGTCILYEMYNAHRESSGSGWAADSGAVFNLRSNNLRPYGWTSADAAGLPILPGLIRYDEVAAGEIKHAIRFTARGTQKGYIPPATHFAGSNEKSLPPMGLRVRLKASYDISQLTGQAKVIATAMKKYGMILADNGSSWFFQGASDARWNDDQLNQLKNIPGSAFEAVDTGSIIH